MPNFRQLRTTCDPLWRAFTLVELIVVVLIIATIAVVAVPRVVDTMNAAQEPGLSRTLQVIRAAIDRYAADHAGKLPGKEATSNAFRNDLLPYLRADFPASPAGAKNKEVLVVASPVRLAPTAIPVHGWKYSNKTGEFICNSGQPTRWDPSVLYSDL